MDEDAVEGAICVVERKESEGKDSYLLKEDRLRQLLLRADCRDKPVVVLSIAGGARKGKSFLLSLFLRYLRAQVSFSALLPRLTPFLLISTFLLFRGLKIGSRMKTPRLQGSHGK